MCPALPGAVCPRAAASLGIPLLQAGVVEGEYPKERLLEDCVVGLGFFFPFFYICFFLEGRYEKIARVQPVPWSGSAWLPPIKCWALASALVRTVALQAPGSLLAVQIISLSRE